MSRSKCHYHRVWAPILRIKWIPHPSLVLDKHLRLAERFHATLYI